MCILRETRGVCVMEEHVDLRKASKGMTEK